MNVTATEPGAPGFVTVFPCGTTRPTASTLNYGSGQSISNAALAEIGSNGDVCVYTLAAAHLVVDVAGWFPNGTDFTTVTPDRLLDTRSAVAATLRASSPRTAWSSCR